LPDEGPVYQPAARCCQQSAAILSTSSGRLYGRKRSDLRMARLGEVERACALVHFVEPLTPSAHVTSVRFCI